MKGGVNFMAVIHNQQNHSSIFRFHGKFMWDSNPRPASHKSDALPIELTSPLEFTCLAVSHDQQIQRGLAALNSFIGLER